MAKRILILGVAINMCLILLLGCSSGIQFNIGYDQKGGFGMKEVDGSEVTHTLEIVGSLEALKDLCVEWSNPAFQEGSEHYTSELSKKIRSYDEMFFNDNVLIVYSFDRGQSKKTRIESLVVDNSKLIVNAAFVSKKGTFSDEAFDR